MKRILRLAGKEWWKDFVPVPLEVIHYIKSGDRAVDLDRFRMQSLRREAFWINKYAVPRGLTPHLRPAVNQRSSDDKDARLVRLNWDNEHSGTHSLVRRGQPRTWP